MVSTRPPNSKSSSAFDNPLLTVPKVLITIGIIFTFVFYCFFFQFPSKVKVLFTFFLFYSVVSRDAYSLSTLSLGCTTLCMVISYLVLWSICSSSSQVHSRKGPEYLTRDTAQVFIPLIRYLLGSFVSSSFLFLPRYSFWILSFISTCLVVSASKNPTYF